MENNSLVHHDTHAMLHRRMSRGGGTGGTVPPPPPRNLPMYLIWAIFGQVSGKFGQYSGMFRPNSGKTPFLFCLFVKIVCPM